MLVLLWVVYVALLLLIALMPYARWDAHVVVGFALVAVGVALRVWALLALGDSYAPAITVYEGQQVVRYGAYAQLAHPLYAGVAIELIGLAVFANSGAGYGLAFVGIAAARVQIAREERLLTATYGSAYTDYRRHVWDFGDSASTGR
jgi:protein-S-isoprenylcysteine O-methyltransferase Ste14